MVRQARYAPAERRGGADRRVAAPLAPASAPLAPASAPLAPASSEAQRLLAEIRRLYHDLPGDSRRGEEMYRTLILAIRAKVDQLRALKEAP
jgi:hypothetical protein